MPTMVSRRRLLQSLFTGVAGVSASGWFPSLAKALATYVERPKFFSPPRPTEAAKHLAEPLLVKFGLPADTSYDLLLCSLFYRTFIADRGDDEKQLEAARKQHPFAGVQAPPHWRTRL